MFCAEQNNPVIRFQESNKLMSRLWLLPFFCFLALTARAQACPPDPLGTNAVCPALCNNAINLERSGPILNQQIKPGEAFSYRVEAKEAGEYLQVNIIQRNIHVTSTLFGPNHHQVLKIFVPFGSNGIEPISIVTPASGTYTILVEASDSDENAGSIDVLITSQRKATAEDHTHYDAEQSFLRADTWRSTLSIDSQKCAIQEFKKALYMFRTLGDQRAEAQTINYLAYSLAILQDFEEAIDYLRPAISIWHSLHDPAGEAEALNNAAYAFSAIGEGEEALKALEKAGPLWRQAGDLNSEVTSLVNLGGLYMDLGQAKEALQPLNDALKIIRKIKAPEMPDIESTIQKEIGRAYYSLNDPENAAKYLNEALRLLPKENGDATLRAAIVNSLGALYIKAGDYIRAFQLFQEAQALFHQTGQKAQEAIVLNNYGGAYRDVKAIQDKEKAINYYKQSLAILDGDVDAEHKGVEAPDIKANSLYNLAVTQRDIGQLLSAKASIEEAINLLEILRQRVARKNFRESYFASRHFYYDLYIDILMRLHEKQPGAGYDGEALRASEQSRGRTLIDLLLSKEGNIGDELSKETIERIRAIQLGLATALRHRRKVLSGDYTPEQANVVEQEVKEKATGFELIRESLVNSSAAVLVQLYPLSVEKIRELLDDDTTVLEYAIGEKRSFVWAISKKGPIVSKEIFTTRAEIRSMVTNLREKLTERNCDKKNETESRRENRIKNGDEQFPEDAKKLSQEILAPISSSLGTSRLVIIADGQLQLIPFEALPFPYPNERTGNSFEPLILNHEIVYLPSITTLAEIRRQREKRTTSTKPIAIFADPVFEMPDSQALKQSINRKGKALINSDLVSRSATSERVRELTRGGECLPDAQLFPPLPGTLKEANNIIAALRPKAGEMLARKFDASISTISKAELSQYRFVHLATHAYVPSSSPEEAGLVLSRFNQRGESQPWFLGLAEINRLKLNADLVTLSACETGLGKDVEGEGLVGLARGFMYAGTPRVVASLWKVEDNATAELMSKFYQGIFKNKLTPAAALHAAQLYMYRNSVNLKWRLPYFWAAFVLEGDWR
jgi:CHAT domain-containing protein/tetratricopeptide (TPR) repeat protein